MQILLIDDHPLFSQSLQFLLMELDATVQVVAVVSVEEAIRHPDPVDLVLLDLHLPNTQGLEGLMTLRTHREGVPVVIVSGDESPTTIQAAIDAGAMGYVPKSSTPQVLLAAIRLILAGGVYLPAHVLPGGRDEVEADAASDASASGGLAMLTRRQREVLMKVVQGKPNKVIARELNIAECTVKSHLSTAYRMLDVDSRTEAVFKTARLGFKV